ncbi:unnamed protein product [Peronospora destructor]|uniref:Mitochondrial import inner membrane translocase subunit TIM22 n=1 Tax=Peronospora destructor TaxID=86335 RepID=A0AAV0V3V9_9STRA|nr:unnamed protein product [Peronospora destructor]
MCRRSVTSRSGLSMGFVGRLLPLLTIASVSSVADRRDILSAPPETSKTSSSDCMSTTALLIFRGLGAGLAWTISVDGYALASMTDNQWKQRIATRPGPTSLGIFGGVSCAMEKARGKKDPLNPFVGGFTAGMAILPGELRNPRTLVTAAFLCGSASMALHHFISKETAKTMVSQ